MITAAFINIWQKRVGAISWDSTNELAYFEYDPTFLRYRLELSPVKMPLITQRIFSFPELRQSNTFKGLPGLLADVLPDRYGNTLMNAWLLKNGRTVNSMNPVEQLCFIGKRGMGAMEFEPVLSANNNQTSNIEIADLVEIATQILAGREDFSTNLSDNEEKALLNILKVGTSAGGARAKAVIAYNEQTGEVRSGQADTPPNFTNWLIKFDGIHDTQFGATSGYGKVEMAYYLMATAAGIDMTECRLLQEHGRSHFMTKRFDRPLNQPKVHIQSFCGLAHLDFNQVGMFSYEQLFETMRFLRLSYQEAEQLFTRMVFNVMARNCDDHTKNFAFMMAQDGQWKLAPAYDICHAYRPNSPWVSQHSLSINGKRQGISREDLITVAQRMNIKMPIDIIENIRAIVENWQSFAQKVGVETTLSEAIAKTLWLV